MTQRCPITYEVCDIEKQYSQRGLNLLDRNLKYLKSFSFKPEEQRLRAIQLAEKLSIQGIQPKLSVTLNVEKAEFEIVEKEGMFILKPPHQDFEELPENEDLTMKLAGIVGINVPLHGMIYNIDGSLTYFIKRFDRLTENRKINVEDFSQLLGLSRGSIYDSSMEKIVSAIDEHCTFPQIEKEKLFRLVIFNFLIGNEDMHLKNYSLIRHPNKVELSPAYDLINTTIILQAKEEIALPIRGKKNKLKRSDLIDYFGSQLLKLSDKILKEELLRFETSLMPWQDLINKSFLSQKLRYPYVELIQSRWQRISDRSS